MVNEINQPEEPTNNDQLGQRLAASNQALADMQAEHRQLLEEMEQLRRRAEDLQRLREQQEREDVERERQYQQTLQENAAANIIEPIEEVQTSEQPTEEEENPEEAEYIREKLAEIARLKAQFKKVQHMINTTEVIEKHLSKNEETTTKPADKPKTSVPVPQKVPLPEVPTKTTITTPVVNETNISALLNTTTSDPIVLPDMPSMADLNAASTQDEKEQLLQTMLSMFEGFSSDLKSQADNLRAERERIRELKESIIRSRQQPPK